MTVIKRDGKKVEFDVKKIERVINLANKSVPPEKRIDAETVTEIVTEPKTTETETEAQYVTETVTESVTVPTINPESKLSQKLKDKIEAIQSPYRLLHW